jgi:hypothetical protein
MSRGDRNQNAALVDMPVSRVGCLLPSTATLFPCTPLLASFILCLASCTVLNPNHYKTRVTCQVSNQEVCSLCRAA